MNPVERPVLAVTRYSRGEYCHNVHIAARIFRICRWSSQTAISVLGNGSSRAEQETRAQPPELLVELLREPNESVGPFLLACLRPDQFAGWCQSIKTYFPYPHLPCHPLFYPPHLRYEAQTSKLNTRCNLPTCGLPKSRCRCKSM